VRGCLTPVHMTGNTSAPIRRPFWRRIVLGLLAILVLLALCGVVYQNIGEAHDRRFSPMPGQRVQVTAGGSSWYMHINCSGQGTPRVVLDSGLGDSFISWEKVQPQIAKFTQVCSYDRAGIGYSDPSLRPRTSEVIAEELHALLEAARISPPYVLVGHSMGGYDVRVFAGRYRNEVAGMVLVDSSHPDQQKRLPIELSGMEAGWLREAEFLAFTMPFGIPRLLELCDENPVARAVACNFHTAREGVKEMKAFRESATEVAASGSLGDLPLVVLSHDPDKASAELPADLVKPTNDAWEKMQEEMAHLSTRGTQSIVKGSAHYIQVDRPDAVIDAVRAVVNQAQQQGTRSVTTP
jgi:pimeloyl-ACP methyl ester carboxylesterase